MFCQPSERTPSIFHLSVSVPVWRLRNHFETFVCKYERKEKFFVEASIVKDEPEVKPALPRRELSLSASWSVCLPVYLSAGARLSLSPVVASGPRRRVSEPNVTFKKNNYSQQSAAV